MRKRLNSPDWRKSIESRFLQGWPAYISCNDGWKELITNLVRDIDDVGVEWGLNQIKEKFGQLRFYYDVVEGASRGQLDKINGLVEEAEVKSSKICEVCGGVGTLRNKAWIQTLCDECCNKEDK
jgi:hypothetical protein